MIIEWWAALSTAMKVLWGVTLSASLVFIIESILTFVGADGGSDFDTDVDMDADFSAEASGGANLYTFRNLVNFLLGFGWTAILLQGKIESTALLLVVASIVGIALVALVMYMFKWLSGMQQSGTINLYKSAVGCQGKVYLSVPAGRSGTGKVQITINHSVREYEALTDGAALPTGTSVVVVEVIDGNTLLVEPQNTIII